MSEAALKQFQEQGSFDVTARKQTSLPELLKLLPDYDALFVRSATQVTREVLEAGTRLKLVLRLGAGLDNVDIPSAREKNIEVMNTAAANALSAAEQTIALMYSLARFVPQSVQSLAMGEWRRADFVGFELTGKTLGVLGCGQIGRIVMEKALGIGMNVSAYDPFVKELSEDLGARVELKNSIEDLVASADLVTLHIPRTAETKNLFNTELLSKMKKGSYLLNVARGGIIDEKALLEALNLGHIEGAALDVFEKEPPVFPNKLITHPKVIATPHLGASTHEAQERVGLVAFEQTRKFFKI
jgi:D-3-phosphoglycerate dehydrogenase / 2-oxoglutarate reductase